MAMRKISLCFLTLMFVISFSLSAQETITLTTYYPSPFGIYSRLVTNSLGVGDTDGSGGLDEADGPDPAVAGQEGDVWIAGNVGIGTTDPETRLDVNGEIKLGNTSTNCSLDTVGSIRYNSSAKRVEFCNGSI